MVDGTGDDAHNAGTNSDKRPSEGVEFNSGFSWFGEDGFAAVSALPPPVQTCGMMEMHGGQEELLVVGSCRRAGAVGARPQEQHVEQKHAQNINNLMHCTCRESSEVHLQPRRIRLPPVEREVRASRLVSDMLVHACRAFFRLSMWLPCCLVSLVLSYSLAGCSYVSGVLLCLVDVL